jgi:hypothetical protein
MLAVTNIPLSNSLFLIKPTHCSLRTSFPSTFAARPARNYTLLRASSAAGSAPIPEEEPSTSAAPSSPSTDPSTVTGFQKLASWWKEKQQKSAELRKRLVSLGPAAVLAYGEKRNASQNLNFTISSTIKRYHLPRSKTISWPFSH